jgi:hypothetical protein
LDIHNLETLRRKHPAWRLLAADHAPLIISFLHRTFVLPNARALPQSEVSSKLEDFLYHLRQERGEETFPRDAETYLEEWAGDDRGWLRRYYIEIGDEPHFDLTPASEKVIEWLASFEQKAFIGAESRLLTIFDLLRQMIQGAETDPVARIAELEKNKMEIEAEIGRIRDGELRLMEPIQLKERYYQVEQTARTILTDFRQVEQNFRDLDRTVREQITIWEGSKGDLLEKVFGDRDTIADSDQGRSFRAFWDFLMSPARQEELSGLLERILALAPVKELNPDRRLGRIHYDWLEAGEAAQRTVARLSEQLRKYLDDRAWLENRRIMSVIREIEQQALAVRNEPPTGNFLELDGSSPTLALTMERPLFTPPLKARIEEQVLEAGSEAVVTDALFEQIYVDKERLAGHIRQALQTRDQVTLAALLRDHPLEQGLAELIGYFNLAAERHDKAVIDEKQPETICWTDAEGSRRQATMPTVIFTR